MRTLRGEGRGVRIFFLTAALFAAAAAGADAQPQATASPAATATAAATSAPLAFAVQRAGLVPGGTQRIAVTGGTAPFTVTTSFAIDAAYDAGAQSLVLNGRAPGSGSVTLTDANGASATVAVLVAPPAGVVPADLTVQLAGTSDAAFVRAQMQAAIGAGAHLRPGASAALGAVTIPAVVAPGAAIDIAASVTIAGNGTSIDANGTAMIHLRAIGLPRIEPTVLFYSDDPEKITADAQGVLFHGTLDAAHPARLYAYHLTVAPRRIVVMLSTNGSAVAHVQILGALAGPSGMFAYVGHLATARFISARDRQQSVIVPVSSDAPYVLDLGIIPPGQLIAAIDDLRIIDGDAVDAVVIAADPAQDPAAFLQQPQLASDGHGRRGEFSLAAIPPLALSYTVGGPEPAPFVVGVPTFPNIVAGGRALGGDYGVVRDIDLHIVNPSAQTQGVYLYEELGRTNGGATTTIRFTGDPAVTEVPCIGHAGTRFLVRSFGVAPNAEIRISGAYMTDGTSSFPLSFGLTSVPPTAPGKTECGAPRPGAGP